MEVWRQCVSWLCRCGILPLCVARLTDLVQMLRDGVLLCQLLNTLQPHTINTKDINLRPHMSQFLCVKNIKTFLLACTEKFGMKKSEMFDACDLFDVRDFGKVIDCLSKLSHTSIALQSGIRPFPTEQSEENEDVYIHLAELIDEQMVEDVYDPVYGDVEGEDVYEDLMRIDTGSQMKQAEQDIRSCCLSEIKQTEDKYTETLESIEKYFMLPLKKLMSPVEIDHIFLNIPDLVKVHRTLRLDIQDSIQNQNASNLFHVFTSYKDKLLIYGHYCSHVESAISVLDSLCKEKEDIRLRLEECSKRANNGKFTLRDLLVVPMQRVLKYPLLLQELVKHSHDASEKDNLRLALDAMRDLAQYVNEVKRDCETLREIDQYQRSIENLNQPLLTYGRPKGDGEVRVASHLDKRKQDRHIFLFDVAAIVCKRRGDNYEMKDVIELNHYKITNNPTADKEGRKWCYGFYLTHQHGTGGFEFFFKTMELKIKWLEQFEMAISNIRPKNARSNSHLFHLHTFHRITCCTCCNMLLRGIFNQGYLCPKCGTGAHKECLGRLGQCGGADAVMPRGQRKLTRGKLHDPGLPKMLVIREYLGLPASPAGPALHMQVGDVVEVTCADPQSCWWQGRVVESSEVGMFPSDAVRPCPCVPRQVDYSSQPWFAGLMERHDAEAELIERENSTYMIRHRSRESNQFAISIKYNNVVKHIKILTKDSCFYIAESRTFKTVMGLVEYYKRHSLREGFRSLDTTLKIPYKEPSSSLNHSSNQSTALDISSSCSFTPPSNSPFWSVFSPRVLSVAVVRYDFSSRDRREISLQVGDLVNIYTKYQDGWWRGEVNGRVGWFPSTYVEEEE